ncbi:hypothetical protein BCR34DRAFT_577822 [Clohesyomyces aquaticus]|uniref:Uncharacterized protein n=1 Tax=Clohesyomyces aquaticus TaxID=1231657 RepID=A0A1Y1YHV5_9PLEO|nr:hypothetical protein BCR34DRAFT_577822 [Clohesyomyces aquaticus]
MMGGEDRTYWGSAGAGGSSRGGATGALFLAGAAAFLDSFAAFYGASLSLAVAGAATGFLAGFLTLTATSALNRD